jgi:hypothetical protein
MDRRRTTRHALRSRRFHDSAKTPERWRQLEQLYHRALEIPADRRSAFLEEACGADEALRQEVESLIAYETRAARDFTTRRHEVLPWMVGSNSTAEPQARIRVAVGDSVSRPTAPNTTRTESADQSAT